jgi:hypothetical protein
MSHIKNVEAFGKLTGICTGYGGTYNPGNPNLQAQAMSALMNNARQVINEVHTAKTEYDNVTNTRELMFKNVKRFSTRIISALKSSGADKLTIEDAQTSIRKMVGSRVQSVQPAESLTSAEVVKPKTRRARGMDYASLSNHFAALVKTVSATPNYCPNEEKLSAAGLNALWLTLVNLNDSVNAATAQLSSARSKRNQLLYDNHFNLVEVGLQAKQYIRSAFGPTSDQYQEVRKIRFTKPKS